MKIEDVLALINILITRILQAVLTRAETIDTSDLFIWRTADAALAERAAQRK